MTYAEYAFLVAVFEYYTAREFGSAATYHDAIANLMQISDGTGEPGELRLQT